MIGWLSCAFVIYTSRGHTQPLSRSFAHLAVVGALVALIGFGFHVARMFSWTAMTYATSISTILVYMFIMPAWLVWLAIQLRARSDTVAYASSSSSKEEGDVEMAGPTSSAHMQASSVAAGSISADDPNGFA